MSRDRLPTVFDRLRARSAWALVVVAVCLATEARGSDREPTFRIRLQWTGETAGLWRGKLTVNRGGFSAPQSLGVARDDAETIQFNEEGVLVRRRSARQTDGFEIGVKAPPDARLEFDLADELADESADGPSLHVQFSLNECLEKTRHFPSHGEQPHLAIRRVPGNALAVGFDRPHLVFDPEEPFRLAVGLNLFDGRHALDKAGKTTLKWKLRPEDGGQPVSEESFPVAAAMKASGNVTIPVEVRMPREEGVYSLWLELSGYGFDDLERAVQVIVVDQAEAKPASGARHSEKLVDSFEPHSPGLFRKVSHKRLVGCYLHQPALAENFGAPRVFDAAEQIDVDDWHTFVVAGRRLVDFVHSQQQSALMLAVFADGAALYPSRCIGSSLRYDNGRLASSGQDPIQKDVLELILRLFDRAGLALVPEMQFDTPLPAIERLLREGNSSEDLQLVDCEGRPRAATHADSARAAPGYNILSSRVQEAVADVVAELVERYKTHPSLAGVAFELGPQSFLQLPGLEWGYDRETVRRFEQATQIRVPHTTGDGWRPEAYRFLTTTARREWIRFRCAEVARFHRRLGDLVAAAIPAGHVVFSGNLPQAGESASAAAILEAVRAGSNSAQMLQSQGLNFAQREYAADAKTTVLRPIMQTPSADRLGSAALATLNDSPVIDALYGGGHRGGLLRTFAMNQPPRPARGVQYGAAVERFGRQVVAGPEATARRYAHLLAATDAQIIFDGGDGISLSPDEAIGRMRRTIARLPDVPFHSAGPKVQPLVVRAALLGQATYLYAVNDSSMPLRFELFVDCPPVTVCRSLDTGQAVTLEPVLDGRSSRLVVESSGHGLAAWRFERAGVAVTDTKLTVSEELLGLTERRISSLSTRPAPTIKLAGAESGPGAAPGLGDDQVRQLTKTMASVKLAWEEERYADCQRLLDGYWGQLLLPEPGAPPATTPTRIGDRVRNALRR